MSNRDQGIHSINFTSADMTALTYIFEDDLVVENEPLHDRSLDAIVDKPWGWECRVFADHFIDVWMLHIAAGERTSMHAHVKKKTYLLCLSGEGAVRSLHGEQALQAGSICAIAPGAFHSTRALGGPLSLIEVETPRNKFDLVRLEDIYDRNRTRYETRENSHSITSMTRVESKPGASIRTRSPDGAFVFRMRNGADIVPDSDRLDLFYIPTGLPALLAPNFVPALRTGDLDQIEDQSGADYLIARRVTQVGSKI